MATAFQFFFERGARQSVSANAASQSLGTVPQNELWKIAHVSWSANPGVENFAVMIANATVRANPFGLNTDVDIRFYRILTGSGTLGTDVGAAFNRSDINRTIPFSNVSDFFYPGDNVFALFNTPQAITWFYRIYRFRNTNF